jgi:hypothetical protein
VYRCLDGWNEPSFPTLQGTFRFAGIYLDGKIERVDTSRCISVEGANDYEQNERVFLLKLSKGIYFIERREKNNQYIQIVQVSTLHAMDWIFQEFGSIVPPKVKVFVDVENINESTSGDSEGLGLVCLACHLKQREAEVRIENMRGKKVAPMLRQLVKARRPMSGKALASKSKIPYTPTLVQ